MFFVYLQYWLFIVALLSIIGIYSAFFTRRIRDDQFSLKKLETTRFGERMFGYWVLLAFIVRLMTSIYIDVYPLYICCMFTFVVAFLAYVTECFFVKTIPLKSALGPFFIAGISFIWMAIELFE
eukprot:TRINITY_DN16583_c0_g1_i1.p1 TRINITY_DN16583_c0_g1~~TRINITY_DN16583_c0_g1_i1.p1  ORF type:complete len:124 (+),score=10.80 TRINITY_DN16583_c0_g1_i1:85-456(+)